MVTAERKHCFIFLLYEEKWNSVLSPQGLRAAQELLFLLNLLYFTLFICRHPLCSRESSQDHQPRPRAAGILLSLLMQKISTKLCPWMSNEGLGQNRVSCIRGWRWGRNLRSCFLLSGQRTLVLDNAAQLRTVAESTGSQLHWLWNECCRKSFLVTVGLATKSLKIMF